MRQRIKRSYLKKEELQQTVLAVLHYLKQKIPAQGPLTLEDAIAEVQKNETLFDDIDYKSSTLVQTLNHLTSEYKDIAIESINSFETSNKNIQKITKTHEKRFEKLYETSNEGSIDMGAIKEKFSDMQDHIAKEVERANVEIAHLRQKVKLLEESSNKDPLTKTLNRRALTNYLHTLCSKEIHTHDIHLLMLDIDNFKQINDKYGHIAGDKILIFIARILTKILREGDKVFRYGGEEFVIILNRIEENNCTKIAHRILELISGNTLVYKGETIRVTVSIGGTKFRPSDTPDEILNRADKALYEAKHAGKNRFVIYEEKETN